MTDTYDIYAIKYGDHDRKASENFLGGDPHDGPMPIDYFVWAIVGETRTFLQDGDRVVLEGWARGEGGVPIGFGTVEGTVLPARE